jgi:hypothetical protein
LGLTKVVQYQQKDDRGFSKARQLKNRKALYEHTQELCPTAKKFGSGVVSNQTEILSACQFSTAKTQEYWTLPNAALIVP